MTGESSSRSGTVAPPTPSETRTPSKARSGICYPLSSDFRILTTQALTQPLWTGEISAKNRRVFAVAYTAPDL